MSDYEALDVSSKGTENKGGFTQAGIEVGN